MRTYKLIRWPNSNKIPFETTQPQPPPPNITLHLSTNELFSHLQSCHFTQSPPDLFGPNCRPLPWAQRAKQNHRNTQQPYPGRPGLSAGLGGVTCLHIEQGAGFTHTHTENFQECTTAVIVFLVRSASNKGLQGLGPVRYERRKRGREKGISTGRTGGEEQIWTPQRTVESGNSSACRGACLPGRRPCHQPERPVHVILGTRRLSGVLSKYWTRGFVRGWTPLVLSLNGLVSPQGREERAKGES